MQSIPQSKGIIAALRAVVAWLDENATPYVVVGGLAASVLGEPRQTRDVDLVAAISTADVEGALKQARAFGLSPAHPDAVALAQKYNMLRLQLDSDSVCVDVFLAATPLERDIINSGRMFGGGNFTYKLVSPEYLVVMKIISGRAHDIAHCADVIAHQPGLDWDLIERVVTGWGETVERPGCTETLEQVKKLIRK